MYLQLTADVGESISGCLQEAHELCKRLHVNVRFKFNNYTVRVYTNGSELIWDLEQGRLMDYCEAEKRIVPSGHDIGEAKTLFSGD